MQSPPFGGTHSSMIAGGQAHINVGKPVPAKKREPSAIATSISGTSCCICLQMSTKGNTLEECQDCGIKVHRSCYGTHGVPDLIDWLCRPCQRRNELMDAFKRDETSALDSGSRNTQHSSSNEISSATGSIEPNSSEPLSNETKCFLRPSCEICGLRDGAFSEVGTNENSCEAIMVSSPTKWNPMKHKGEAVKGLHQDGAWKTACLVDFRKRRYTDGNESCDFSFEYKIRWGNNEPDQWLLRDRFRRIVPPADTQLASKDSPRPITSPAQLDTAWRRSRWVHTSCASWTPNLWINKETGKVHGLDTLYSRTAFKMCYVCQSRGPCDSMVSCSKDGCAVSFHAECGIRSGFSFTKDNRGSKFQFCGEHSNLGRPKRIRREPSYFLKESGEESARDDMRKLEKTPSSRQGKSKVKTEVEKSIGGGEKAETSAKKSIEKKDTTRIRKDSTKKVDGPAPTSRRQAEAQFKRGSGRSQRRDDAVEETDIALGDGTVIKSRDELWDHIDRIYFADINEEKLKQLRKNSQRSIEIGLNLQIGPHGSWKRGSKKKKKRTPKKQTSLVNAKLDASDVDGGGPREVNESGIGADFHGPLLEMKQAEPRTSGSGPFQETGGDPKHSTFPSQGSAGPGGLHASHVDGTSTSTPHDVSILCPNPNAELTQQRHQVKGISEKQTPDLQQKLLQLQARVQKVFMANQRRLKVIAEAASKACTGSEEGSKERINATLNSYKELVRRREFEESLKLHIRYREQDNAEENESEVICTICGDGDDDIKGNQILLCDCCDVAVHQKCYGVPKVPSTDWFCRRCKLHAFGESCCVCGNPNGALKPTTDGRWAHVVCAFYIPELYIKNDQKMEPIAGIQEISNQRRQLKCLYCDEKKLTIQPFVTRIRLQRTLKGGYAIKDSYRAPELEDLRKESQKGACVQCCHARCLVAFHPQCARERGIQMEQNTKRRDCQWVTYCEKHRTRKRPYKMSTYYKEPKCQKMPPPPNLKLLDLIDSYNEELSPDFDDSSDSVDTDNEIEVSSESEDLEEAVEEIKKEAKGEDAMVEDSSDEELEDDKEEEEENDPDIEEAPLAEIKLHSACQICTSSSDWGENRLLICAACNIKVHEGCYGVNNSIKTESGSGRRSKDGSESNCPEIWLCEPCRQFPVECWDTQHLLKWARESSLPRIVGRSLEEKNITGFMLRYKPKMVMELLQLPPDLRNKLKDGRKDLLNLKDSHNGPVTEDGFVKQEDLKKIGKLIPPRRIPCNICGQSSRSPTPMKSSAAGGWVHLSCSLWTPEITFSNLSKLSPVTGIQKIYAARRHPKCQICQDPCCSTESRATGSSSLHLQNRMGASIQCSYTNCNAAFHAQCALQNNLLKIYVAQNPKQSCSYSPTSSQQTSSQICLPIFSGTGENAEKIGDLNPGEFVDVLEWRCGWARIAFGGQEKTGKRVSEDNDAVSPQQKSAWVRIRSNGFLLGRSKGQDSGQILFAAMCPKHAGRRPFLQFYKNKSWYALRWGTNQELKSIQNSKGDNFMIYDSTAILPYDPLKHFPLSDYLSVLENSLQDNKLNGKTQSPQEKSNGRGRSRSRRSRKKENLQDKILIALKEHMRSMLRKLQKTSKENNRKRDFIVLNIDDPTARWCYCRQPQHTFHNPEGIMVECEKCNEWFHESCLGLLPHQVNWLVESSWKCPICVASERLPQLLEYPLPPPEVEDPNKPPEDSTHAVENGTLKVKISFQPKNSSSCPPNLKSFFKRSPDKPKRSPDKPKRSPDKPKRSPDKPRCNPDKPLLSLFELNDGIMRIPITKELQRELRKNRQGQNVKDTSMRMKIPFGFKSEQSRLEREARLRERERRKNCQAQTPLRVMSRGSRRRVVDQQKKPMLWQDDKLEQTSKAIHNGILSNHVRTPPLRNLGASTSRQLVSQNDRDSRRLRSSAKRVVNSIHEVGSLRKRPGNDVGAPVQPLKRRKRGRSRKKKTDSEVGLSISEHDTLPMISEHDEKSSMNKNRKAVLIEDRLQVNMSSQTTPILRRKSKRKTQEISPMTKYLSQGLQ